MRTCGNCGWIPDGKSVCYAWGEGRLAEKKDMWSACALWRPKQDWRDETCGTCEFYIDGDCRAGPPVVYGDRYPSPQRQCPACAEWMPREGEE
jgi:hypothetical protein